MTNWELHRARRHADRCKALLTRLTDEGEALLIASPKFMRRHRSVRKAWLLAEIVWFDEMARRTNPAFSTTARDHAAEMRGSLKRLGYKGEI